MGMMGMTGIYPAPTGRERRVKNRMNLGTLGGLGQHKQSQASETAMKGPVSKDNEVGK
jgi:hypothetical protein